ncbi:MAG: hypothetical protein DRP35_08200 [Candidatus Zixiibacteriota bacterium]|nr:MAG: hypothetical protein DRP35_08200 [candidate division Zixibacteria bacterium]
MDNQLNISVKLNGKKFNLTIANDEKTEMIYRQAADMYNEAIQNYKFKQYEGISEKEILSMVAYNFALKFLQIKDVGLANQEDLLLTLQNINQSLDTYLE